jgi:drug/metabolite transporter (DMT)-like permease
MRTQIFYPVILGVMLFNESLSIFLIVGVICLIIGATLVSLERKNKVFITFNYKGIIVACLAALCWGISGVVLKPGIQEIGSPFAALLVSNIATVSVMIIISLGKERQDQIKNLNRKAFITLATASLFTSLAQLGRYASLRITPVSVVDPLILSAYALLVIFLSFIINRQIEIFTWKVLVGSAVTVAGVILLIY